MDHAGDAHHGPDATPTRSVSSAADGLALPLTERVLARLRLPRPVAIAAWSAVPLLSPLVLSAAVALTTVPLDVHAFWDLAATQAGIAFATTVLLVGTRLLVVRAGAVVTDVAALLPGGDAGPLFRRVGSVAGPLVLAVALALIVTGAGLTRYGLLPPLAALPLLVLYLVPIMTFVWVYLVVLLGLDAVGRRPLALDVFPEDRALGLRGLGDLASAGLGLLLVAVAPILVAGSDEPVTLTISVTVVLVGLAAFVLSMWRLHRQMAAAKDRHVALARRLYAEAYAPVRRDPSVAVLGAQATVLGTAKSLVERAEALLTWPIDEGATRFIAVISTSVLTSVIVRALFAAIGF